MTDRTNPANGHEPIDPGAAIGHVAVKVSDLERAVAFDRDALGFTVTGRLADIGAFLAAGGYHHHLAVHTLDSRGGPPPAPGTTGLDHFAVRYPDRRALAGAVRRLLDRQVAIDSASDHGFNEAIYLRDPDGNGIELFADRDPARWARDEEGKLILHQTPLACDGG